MTLCACGSPELEVVLNGDVAESGVHVDLGTTRQHTIVPDAAQIIVRNVGGGTLELSDLDLPQGLSVVRPDLPAEVPADGELVLRIGLAAVGAGAVVGSLRIETNDLDQSVFEVNVSGEVTPYIEIDLQEWDAVDLAISERMQADQLVGMAAAIVEGQRIVWMKGYGKADRENDIDVDPTIARFRWASLSKGLVAVVAADAVRRQELTFDDQIADMIDGYEVPSTYLPDGCTSVDCAVTIPEDDRSLSLRQLLSHTGGAQHYSNGVERPEPPFALRQDPESNTGMAWALDYWTDNPLVAVPGTAYSYSTPGYNLAGVAVEQQIGMSLGEAVEERVSRRLGITTLAPDYAWDPAPDRVAHYEWDDGPALDDDTDVSWKLAGGGFESTVQDMARYCGGLLGDVVVDERIRDEQLWVAQAPAPRYGLGFGVSGEGDSLMISHTGSQQGARTALRIEPAKNRCYVFMSNSNWADSGDYTSLMRAAAP